MCFFVLFSTVLRLPLLYTSVLLGAFAKLRKATVSFVMLVRLSVCPHETTRLPIYGFSWYLIFEYFSKICRENSSFIKIWQEYTFLIISPSVILRMRNVSHKKLQRNLKSHILYSIIFFSKSCRLWDNVEKCRTEQATDDNMAHAHCMFDT
jgi:hypothetical protein